jgi:hypothetical protein
MLKKSIRRRCNILERRAILIGCSIQDESQVGKQYTEAHCHELLDWLTACVEERLCAIVAVCTFTVQ